MTDSDKDGATNGDEMGDPCCVWTAGATPSRTTTLSNPAVKDASFPYPSCALAGAPTLNITISKTTQSTISLDWESEACMCGFTISQILPKSVTNLQVTKLIDPFSGSSQISIGALEPDTQYSFTLSGYNLGGSSPISVEVKTLSVSDSAPGAPTGLKGDSSSSTSLPVTWVAPTVTAAGDLPPTSLGITGYELDIALASDGIFRNVYAGSDTKYVVTPLQPNTTYQLRVRAVNSYGVGLNSPVATMSTSAFNGTAVSAEYTSEDGSFKLGWTIQGSEITCVITGATLGYVAVGWGNTPTMTNSDMVVGSYDSVSGSGSVIDLWSSSQDTPAFDTQQDCKYVSGMQQLSSTMITFTRKLVTGDTKQDIAIEDRGMYLVWAIGNGVVSASNRNSFTVHTKRGAAKINFFTGQTEEVNDDKLKNAHAGLSFFAWGVLIPLGSFIARYKRCDMGVWWYRAHVAMQTTGAALTLIGFIIITTTLGTHYTHFSSTHAICGLVLVILTIGQCALGFYSNYKYNHNRKRAPLFPDRVHGILGLAVMLFAFVTIFLGFQFYHVSLGAWLLGAQCLLFAVTAAFVYEFYDGKED